MPFFNETVPAEFTGTERLDKYLSSLPNAMNRSKLKSGIIELLVNEKKAKLNSKIKAGDKIYFQWEDSIPDDIEPQDIPLDIIYEDENVTVVNKAQGIVTHPAAGNWDGTLVNALLYHWGREAVPQQKNQNSAIFEGRRPGIVHQLKELGGDYGFNSDFKTNSQGKMRCTLNSGRKRKTDKKPFSSRHNDRDFDSNPEHIAKDKSDKNVICSWCGTDINFDKGELKYYEESFGAQLEQTNQNYIKSRHKERVVTMDE